MWLPNSSSNGFPHSTNYTPPCRDPDYDASRDSSSSPLPTSSITYRTSSSWDSTATHSYGNGEATVHSAIFSHPVYTNYYKAHPHNWVTTSSATASMSMEYTTTYTPHAGSATSRRHSCSPHTGYPTNSSMTTASSSTPSTPKPSSYSRSWDRNRNRFAASS